MPTYPTDIREEALKNKVAADYFGNFDCTNILGCIDFSVCIKDSTPILFDNEFLVWGEAKRGRISDFKTSFVQLILTIGKERTFDKYLPPKFLCEFDAKQIAFLPYNAILEFFYQNDFNWNVAPSDHSTAEFHKLYDMVSETLDSSSLVYNFGSDEQLLKKFIKGNMRFTRGIAKAKITKSNFISIYNRWLDEVKPTIDVPWDTLKEHGVLDSDFYLADVMSKDNVPIMEKLQVLLVNDKYILGRNINEMGLFTSSTASFTDNGVAHSRFWLKYERPPKKEYQEYITFRRDLLVPQNIREIKGSYFTPRQCVELAHQYLEDYLGEDWQDNYYVWDCCAGTGNLLAGLANKYRIFASTLDKSDVDVMHTFIDKGNNLLHSHIFQFDFLNDGYSVVNGNMVSSLAECNKIPETLRSILSSEEERKKLIILINAPYKEAGSAKQSAGTGKNVPKVATSTKAYSLFKEEIGNGAQELFAQFIYRIYKDIPGCILAEFSTLKALQGQNFITFRKMFRMSLDKMFIVPSFLFDNIDGDFPIGFKIWKHNETFIQPAQYVSDVFDEHIERLEDKIIVPVSDVDVPLTKWLSATKKNCSGLRIGDINQGRNDFQNQKYCYIWNNVHDLSHRIPIHRGNLIEVCVYYSVRHVIPDTWINDRDQFFAPDEAFREDEKFIGDCIAMTLFNNDISFNEGSNDWIPFLEEEVGAKDCFRSHFVYDFIHGRLPKSSALLEMAEVPSMQEPGTWPIPFSDEALAVFEAGREIWRYYHSKPDVEVNASFYDIKRYFQGFKIDARGKAKMNSSSEDSVYINLLAELRNALKRLALNIEPKIYEYRFLKER